MKGTEMNEQVSADETINEKGDADFSKNLEVVNQNEQNSMPSFQEEEQAIKKKCGGIIPKKPPLISKDHECAFFDSADWALGKQGAHVEKPKGPLEALRPKLQMDEEGEWFTYKCMCAAAYAVAASCYMYYMYFMEEPQESSIPKEPQCYRELYRSAHMRRILSGGSRTCIDYLRMDIGPFLRLCHITRSRRLLRDTRHVTVEEQIAMFLHAVGHNAKNRVLGIQFHRSGETISRYFNVVLGAICGIRDQYMHQASGDLAPEISTSPTWYPWFKDCIGMCDGTYIDVTVPEDEAGPYRSRKGIPTQNVLGVCLPDKSFCYVLAGYEGSANDFTVLKKALKMPEPYGLRVLQGKYYLCDMGYTTMPGFIAPYQGTRYHLKEWEGQTPKNHRELFNLRHSSLRCKIENAFGILKNRFKILASHPFFPLETQVELVLACAVLHNYILKVDPNDPFARMECEPEPDNGEVFNESTQDYGTGLSQREQKQANRVWLELRENMACEMWHDYCMTHCNEDTTETNME